MFNSKYSNVLTVILVIVIIAIIALIGFLGFDYFKKYSIDKDAQDFISEYESQMKNIIAQNPSSNNPIDGNSVPTVIDPIENNNIGNNNGSSTTSKWPKYKGFNVLGYIEIPKTGIQYPVLDKVTPKSLETSVAYYYGPGLNEIGNTTISGHNYRSGAFFGKNKQLRAGDAIYIKDNSGRRIKYTIYKTYTTTETDSEYITRDTNGAREISLTTCTDNSKGRLIVLAREQ